MRSLVRMLVTWFVTPSPLSILRMYRKRLSDKLETVDREFPPPLRLRVRTVLCEQIHKTDQALSA